MLEYILQHSCGARGQLSVVCSFIMWAPGSQFRPSGLVWQAPVPDPKLAFIICLFDFVLRQGLIQPRTCSADQAGLEFRDPSLCWD